MFTVPFWYRKVDTLEEATALLREHGEAARPLAGGQSLIPMLNLGMVHADVLVDIGGISELRGVARRGPTIVVGAATRYREMENAPLISEDLPLLIEALRHVGNPRVRNRGTIGGSIAHSDPAAELPAVMLALEATYMISDGPTTRTVLASAFHQGLYETALNEGELLAQVSVPVLEPEWGWGFAELARRPGDFAIVAAVALARCRDGVVSDVRLALAGAADRPVRCRTVEAATKGMRVEELGAVISAIGEDMDPMDDVIASRTYRQRVAPVIALRAIRDACRRCEKGGR